MRHLFSLLSQTIPKGFGILVKFCVHRIFETCFYPFFFSTELLVMRTYGKENFFQLKIRCACTGLGICLAAELSSFNLCTLPRRTVAPLSQLSLGHVCMHVCYYKKKRKRCLRNRKALLHLATSVTNGDKRAQKRLKELCNWNKSIKE